VGSGRGAIALVAHDQMKDAMVAFARDHSAELARFALYATGTTGTRILEACPKLAITRLKSGPLGGDQQIGSLIADGTISALFSLSIRYRRCRTTSTSKR
jgi:methylglyoxal synthase